MKADVTDSQGFKKGNSYFTNKMHLTQKVNFNTYLLCSKETNKIPNVYQL